jgi:dCMP deaminase
MTTNLAPEHHPPIELDQREQDLLRLARRVAEDSPDRSRKTGAVIVDSQGQVISIGCNTLPDGIEHEDRFLTRPGKYDWTEHAERNAVFAVARAKDKSTEGCEMITPWFPCVPCARAIVQAGITRLVCPYPDTQDESWGKDFITALELLERAGVKFDHFIDDRPPPKAVADQDAVVVVIDETRVSAHAWVEHFNREGRLPEDEAHIVHTKPRRLRR